MNPGESFRGRRVLLTGHTGFKGSWLALWLQELGAEVHGFALPPATSPSHFDLCQLGNRLQHREGDLRDAAAVQAAFAAAQPEFVFHLGAQALVRDSYQDPKGTFDTNVGGTVNVLEGIRLTPSVRAAVIVTSDKCYENKEWEFAYRETDPMGGHDPYSASKGAAEVVAAAYRRSFFSGGKRVVGLATVRAGNVIGGGDWSRDRLIPDCVRALCAERPIVLRNPASVRPWQHVLEPLGGYLLVAARLAEAPARYATAYNFGPDGSDHVPVSELAGMFTQAWGSGRLELLQPAPDAPHEAHLLRLACDRARSALGWRPRLTTREAIEWTARWYRQWSQERPGTDLSALALEQIREYQRRLALPR